MEHKARPFIPQTPCFVTQCANRTRKKLTEARTRSSLFALCRCWSKKGIVYNGKIRLCMMGQQNGTDILICPFVLKGECADSKQNERQFVASGPQWQRQQQPWKEKRSRERVSMCRGDRNTKGKLKVRGKRNRLWTDTNLIGIGVQEKKYQRRCRCYLAT